jgi:hypothetical protein
VEFEVAGQLAGSVGEDAGGLFDGQSLQNPGTNELCCPESLTTRHVTDQFNGLWIEAHGERRGERPPWPLHLDLFVLTRGELIYPRLLPEAGSSSRESDFGMCSPMSLR